MRGIKTENRKVMRIHHCANILIYLGSSLYALLPMKRKQHAAEVISENKANKAIFIIKVETSVIVMFNFDLRSCYMQKSKCIYPKGMDIGANVYKKLMFD